MEPQSAAARGDHEPRTVRLPADWRDVFGPRGGTATFSRRFQQPTNVDADERLVITVCDPRCEIRAKLNGTPLRPLDEPCGDPACAPGADAVSFDITGQTAATNHLQLELTVTDSASSSGPCGLWQPVFLEIITPE